MKKVLSLMIVLCLMLSCVPAIAEEEEQIISETWQIVYDWRNKTSLFWAEINGDICTIKAVAQYQNDELIIPCKENLYVKVDPVHSTIGDPITVSTLLIDKDAFKKGADMVQTIIFTDGWEALPDGLCEGMYNLKTVNLPQSVYVIGRNCFKNCENLDIINLENIENIDQSAFECCTSLKRVTLSDRINTIGNYAFKGCENLEEVKGWNENINIGEDAFANTKFVLKKENPTEQRFKDVAVDAEYAEAVDKLAELGIMEGFDGRFIPQAVLTRAEAAAMIVRLLNCENEVKQEKTNYTDVPENHWASGYINYAEENGIINGQGDDTFAPEEFVTYHGLIKMLVCALGYEPMGMANGGWNYGGYITAAKEIGLIENEPEKKDAFITRGEAALMCYNALGIDLMEKTWYNCTGMGASAFEILEDKNILTEYWGMDYEEVRKFCFEKVFGFELPKSAESVNGEYWVDDGTTRETCYMGKISFFETDLEYIMGNLEKQDFQDGVAVEDSEILQSAKHTRDAHSDWWDAGTYGTEKEHYHWIKEDKTYRYTRAVEFEAYIILDSAGIYWLYVYKCDSEKSYK